LGFLGDSLFRCQNPRIWGLEKLGFPWILSCETSLINGLRGYFLNFFSCRICRRESAVETARTTIWHGEGTDCSSGKLNSVSDFLKDFAIRPASPSKSNSL
jgi:hypothetical protein